MAMFLIVLKPILRRGCSGDGGALRGESRLTGLLGKARLALGEGVLALGLLLALSERVALRRRSGHVEVPL
ncbi:hypothetical protein SHIRM173S_09688 [Streptomyces hirsutus]